MRALRKISLSIILALSASSAALSEVIIVMDMSASMYGQIDHTPKINIARNALRELIEGLDEGTVVGLEQVGGTGKTGCKNFALTVPPSTRNHDKILSHINSVYPKGKTPMRSALLEASRSLSTKRGTIILISDGKERCGGGSCHLAKELKRANSHLRINVISLAKNISSSSNLRCIADATGGSYRNIDESPINESPYAATDTSPPKAQQTKSIGIATSSYIILYAELPYEKGSDTVEHRVYNRNGSLILRCTSTAEQECQESIEPGNYIVHSTHNGTEQQTKLFVVKGADAYLYTSFKSKTTGGSQYSEIVVPKYSDGSGSDTMEADAEDELALKEEAEMVEAIMEIKQKKAEKKESKSDEIIDS